MSFILDALKKSESDRQRQSGPALFEVKVAPPRSHLPLWAVVLGVLLVANAVIVGWVLLRRPAHPEIAAAQPNMLPGAVPLTTAPQAVAPQSPPLATAVPASAAAPGAVAPPAASPAAAAPPPAAATADDTSAEDLAPATDAPPAPANAAVQAATAAPTLGGHVRRGTADGVPLYQDVAAMPNTHVPQLRLDLHVYAQRPEERFVMINMKKLREGDSLPEGVHVDSITPEGAVLTYAGSRFLLPRD